MGIKDKLILRFLSQPKDFTWDEMNRLLESLGFEAGNKGKTSGSRIIFKKKDSNSILLHKPHPGNIVKRYVMKQVLDQLKKDKLL